MSDILIKNMKMPETCADCNFSTWNGFESVYCDVNAEFIPRKEWKEKRQDWCPLIEVPPHGRLIDADVLKKKWLEAENRMGADKVIELPLKEYITNGCVYDLDNAPTIIEAENGT